MYSVVKVNSMIFLNFKSFKFNNLQLKYNTDNLQF